MGFRQSKTGFRIFQARCFSTQHTFSLTFPCMQQSPSVSRDLNHCRRWNVRFFSFQYRKCIQSSHTNRWKKIQTGLHMHKTVFITYFHKQWLHPNQLIQVVGWQKRERMNPFHVLPVGWRYLQSRTWFHTFIPFFFSIHTNFILCAKRRSNCVNRNIEPFVPFTLSLAAEIQIVCYCIIIKPMN